MSWPCVFEAQFTALQQAALGYAPSSLGLETQPLTQLCTNFGDGLVNYFKLDHCVIGPTLLNFGLVSFIVEENSS